MYHFPLIIFVLPSQPVLLTEYMDGPNTNTYQSVLQSALASNRLGPKVAKNRRKVPKKCQIIQENVRHLYEALSKETTKNLLNLKERSEIAAAQNETVHDKKKPYKY